MYQLHYFPSNANAAPYMVLEELAHIPDGERVYVSIDIDSFDPSIAPGTATISHGGFSCYEEGHSARSR